MDSGCPECGDRKLIVACVERGGWLVKCSNTHELFPFPGMTIIAHDPEIIPTKLTYRSR